MEAAFEEGLFKPRYQRNNKRSGQKNLRCFPACSSRAHSSSGFCGQQVTVTVSSLPAPLPPGCVYRAWGEFVQCGADVSMQPGQTMRLHDADLKERNRANPLRDWVRGEVSEAGPDKITVMVNRSLLGWHYGWVSSKHTCDAMHCFKVHLFVLDAAGEELSYLGSVESPSFQLFSRRRQAMVMEARETIEKEAVQKKREARPNLGHVVLPPAKKRMCGDSAMQVRIQRNLCLDRLVRLMLVRSGSGTRSMYDTDYQSESQKPPSAKKAAPNSSAANTMLSTMMKGPIKKPPMPAARNGPAAKLRPREKATGPAPGGYAPPPPPHADLGGAAGPDFSDAMPIKQESNAAPLQPATAPAAGQVAEDPFSADWADLDFRPFGSNGSPFLGMGGDIRVGEGLDDAEFDRLIEEALLDPQLMSSEDADQVESKSRSRAGSVSSASGAASESPKTPQQLTRAHKGARGTEAPSRPSAQDVAAAGIETAQAEWDSGCIFTKKLDFIVRTHGSENTKKKADHIVSVLRQLPDRLVSVSTNRPDFLAFFTRWKSPEGIRMLREQFAQGEGDAGSSSGVASFVRDEELANHFDTNEGTSISPMRSVYAEMRIIYRRVILDALTSLGGDPDDFVETMDLCARYGLLFVDPYYPPSKRVAAMTHLELYNSLEKFRDEDFGSCAGEFRNEAQRTAWVNAYWTVRRRSFRRHFIKAVLNEHVGSKLPPEGRPVSPEFDLSGTWVQTSTRDDAAEVEAWGLRVGVGVGKLSARLFESMWKRLTLRINTAALHLQGERVLLANPAKLFYLDRIPRKYTVSNPLPMATFALERTYIAWLGYDKSNSKAYLHLVFGGRTRSPSFEEYSKHAMFVNDAEIRREAEEVPKFTEMRIVKRLHVAADRETMTLDHKIHLFNDDTAPRWDDVKALAGLFETGQHSCVVSYSTKYIKVSDQGLEDVLELLE